LVSGGRHSLTPKEMLGQKCCKQISLQKNVEKEIAKNQAILMLAPLRNRLTNVGLPLAQYALK